MKTSLNIAVLAILVTLAAHSKADAKPLSLWESAGTWFNNVTKEPKEGEVAPETLGETLERKTVTTKDYSGKMLFLSFWAPWCPPCKAEFLELPNLEASLPKEGIQFLSIAVFTNRGELDSFLKQHPTKTTVLLDKDKQASTAYAIHTTPTSFLIDEKGEIIRIWPDALDMEAARQEILLLLKKEHHDK